VSFTFEVGGAQVTIKPGGSPLATTIGAYVTSATLKISSEMMDTIDFTLELPPGDAGNKFHKDIAGWYGQQLEIEIKDSGGVGGSGYGDIIEISYESSHQGGHRVTVHAIDAMHRLKKGRKTTKLNDRRFKDKTATDIVKVVAGDHGLSAGNADSLGSQYPEWKAEMDDAALLKKLADDNNFMVRIDKGTSLVFVKRDSMLSDAKVTYDFPTEVFSVNMTTSLAGIVTGAVLKGANTQDNKEAEADVQGSVVSGSMTGPGLLESAGIDNVVTVEATGDSTNSVTSEVKARGEAIIKNAAETFISGSLDGVLKMDAMSGHTLELENAKWPFDSPFRITEITHTVSDSGANTSISFSGTALKSAS